MHVFKTVQGWLIVDIVDGYLTQIQYIGYTKAQAIKIFSKRHKLTK